MSFLTLVRSLSYVNQHNGSKNEIYKKNIFEETLNWYKKSSKYFMKTGFLKFPQRWSFHIKRLSDSIFFWNHLKSIRTSSNMALLQSKASWFFCFQCRIVERVASQHIFPAEVMDGKCFTYLCQVYLKVSAVELFKARVRLFNISHESGICLVTFSYSHGLLREKSLSSCWRDGSGNCLILWGVCSPIWRTMYAF